MTKLPLCLLLIAPVAALTPSIASTSAPAHRHAPEHLIRPGQSLGPCKLGAWTSTLTALKSCPPRDNDAAMGHYIDRYQASAKDPCDSLRVYAVRDAATGGEKENIEQVWTSSPIFATSSGVRVGDNLTKIKHAYPGTKRVTYITDSDRYVTLYDDRQDGIAFEFYQNKCWGIIVHPKGAAVDEEYMHIWD